MAGKRVQRFRLWVVEANRTTWRSELNYILMDKHAQSLQALGNDLENRFRYPQQSFTFYAQLFVTVIGCGGAGIWWTIHVDGLHAGSLAAALLTYFPALVAASTIDFIQDKKIYLRMFGVTVGIVLAALFLIAVTRSPGWQLWWALMGTIFSILFWWLANGEKDWVKDNIPTTSTGGDVNQQLPRTETGWNTEGPKNE